MYTRPRTAAALGSLEGGKCRIGAELIFDLVSALGRLPAASAGAVSNFLRRIGVRRRGIRLETRVRALGMHQELFEEGLSHTSYSVVVTG
jgi:hypothetical protein